MSLPNRVLVIAAVAALGVTLLASGSALAVRGGNGNGNGGNGGGGNFSGTIEFADGIVALATHDLNWGESVMFSVDANVKERDLYKLYVTNQCLKDGVPVLSKSEPVINGVAGPFTLGYESWEGAGECMAWTWMFGSKDISGASMTYSVGP
jgi:hypothetical protein